MEIRERYLVVSEGFARRLHRVRADQWCWPTPCDEWNVRTLVNHMTRGNLNYVALARGGTAEEFKRMREEDALGPDCSRIADAYLASVQECAAAFAGPGALDRTLDYPGGKAAGRQALTVRTADSLIHTWDLARAVGGDDRLDPAQVAWMTESFDDIYAGLNVGAFFKKLDEPNEEARAQDALLQRLGRRV